MNKNTPKCVGIILDGNRRWAREKGLHTLEGHKKGLENLKQITKDARDIGIENLVVYAFSTENWNRSEEEVSYLMDLFSEATESHFSELSKEDVRVRFLGERERFSDKLQELMHRVETDSAQNNKITLWICLSYGGRADILQAVNRVCGKEVSEEEFANNLWTAGLPDPDIIIRTGGEKRLSGFLTWNSVYSELFFVDTYWPDFSKEKLENILEEYSERERRYGK